MKEAAQTLVCAKEEEEKEKVERRERGGREKERERERERMKETRSKLPNANSINKLEAGNCILGCLTL